MKSKRERTEYMQKYMLKRRYDLTAAQFTLIHLKQKGRCAVCDDILVNPFIDNNAKARFKTCVDHNHITGEVRGLLCRRCNTEIGRFNDNPALLRKAADYLEGVIVEVA